MKNFNIKSDSISKNDLNALNNSNLTNIQMENNLKSTLFYNKNIKLDNKFNSNNNILNNKNYDDNNQNYNDIKDTSNTSYKELLEQKIRNQAKRLCELQDYKNLCEKRIIQIFPGHPIPLEEKHLDMNENHNSQEYLTQNKKYLNTSQNFNINIIEKV